MIETAHRRDPEGTAGRDSLETAARRLADWGFLAVPDLPDRPGPASLIVALRPTPTLRHYDPETIEYRASSDARGDRRVLTRHSRTPWRHEFSWGEIRITDRLGVTNESLAFGGTVEADQVDDAVIVRFTSPAPILRRGGHSQGWDDGADSIGAFFARLLVTVDYVPGFEAELAAAAPLDRYAAFLRDVAARHDRARRVSGIDPPFAALVRSEAQRLGAAHPEAWLAGGRLLERVGHT